MNTPDATNLNQSYIGARPDLLALIPENRKVILDVGCSVGTLGVSIKNRQAARVVGVEFDANSAEIARGLLDSVHCGDVEEMDFDHLFGGEKFDCIVLGDVLEHLKEPWDFLSKCTRCLDKNGMVVASIPNIRHISTIVSLVIRGYWPYRERGIHDSTHLRFFTRRNVEELFNRAGLEIARMERNYRIIEKGHCLNRFAMIFALPWIREFYTFQFLIVAERGTASWGAE